MKMLTKHFGNSTLRACFRLVTELLPRTNRRARRLSLRRHESETLESRELMSVNPIASLQLTSTQGAQSSVAIGQAQHNQAQINRASRANQQATALSPIGQQHVDWPAVIRPNTRFALSPIGVRPLPILGHGDPNDQIREAIRFGHVTTRPVTGTGTIDNPQDVDMFMIQVGAGERLTFDTDTRAGFDSVIRLFNSRGREIDMNDDGAAPGERRSLESYLDHVFSSGGTYFVGVSGYGNSHYNARTGTGDRNGRTGAYSLTVKSVSNSQTDPPITPFDDENNNLPSRANFIGVFTPGYNSRTFYGSTGAGSDTEDWIRFRIDGNASGTIQISGMLQDLDLRLYTASGQLIGHSTNSGTRTDTINLTSLAAGTYFVRVSPGISGARSAYAMRFGLSVR